VPFDIHTGGVDLKFPHHENEIAQTCGAGNEGLANYFVHNNHLLVNGKKMSKSLGNFYTLRDVEAKGYTPQAFRMLILESHYHSESNFSWEILTAAQNRLTNWKKYADLQWQLPSSDDLSIINSINKRLADDFNTPLALKDIDEYFEKIASLGQSPDANVIKHIKTALGLELTSVDVSKEIKELLKKRQVARSKKDWSLSDKIRDELKEKDIVVRDELNKQIWSRVV
jgi:cysteinyl-tRNA synthetase